MTELQARKLAKQIFASFDERIVEATNGSVVPPSFVAGLIANEPGKDRYGNIVETATRFEPHVFASLKAVRSGTKASYSGIRKAQIADASDAALRALATSYGATQIMGWHVIKNLRCTIADLRSPDKHFFYTVKLLQLNGFPDGATTNQMDREMRQWNTGRETGKTYHENYVPNARLIRKAYSDLEGDRVSRTVEERIGDHSENGLDMVPDPAADLVPTAERHSNTATARRRTKATSLARRSRSRALRSAARRTTVSRRFRLTTTIRSTD